MDHLIGLMYAQLVHVYVRHGLVHKHNMHSAKFLYKLILIYNNQVKTNKSHGFCTELFRNRSFHVIQN